MKVLTVKTEKVCLECSRNLPVNHFSIRHRSSGDYYRTYCRDCCAKLGRKWRSKNPEKSKLSTMRWRNNNPEKIKNYERKRNYQNYGISIEIFEKMLKEQNNRCKNKGCAVEMTIGKKSNSAHLDHNHTTGKVRGILCANCNLALGKVKENLDILRGLEDYIITNN